MNTIESTPFAPPDAAANTSGLGVRASARERSESTVADATTTGATTTTNNTKELHFAGTNAEKLQQLFDHALEQINKNDLGVKDLKLVHSMVLEERAATGSDKPVITTDMARRAIAKFFGEEYLDEPLAR